MATRKRSEMMLKVDELLVELPSKVETFDLGRWRCEVERHCEPDNAMVGEINAFLTMLSRSALDAGIPAEFIVTGSQGYFMPRRGSDIDVVMLDLSAPSLVNHDLESHKRILSNLKDAVLKNWDRRFELKKDPTIFILRKVPCGLIRIELNQPAFHVDICVDRMDAISMTQLLFFSRTQLHQLQPMVVGIKMICEKLEILSTGRGYPSSCSFAIMAIHYLQNCDPPAFGPLDMSMLRLPEIAARKMGQAVLGGQAADTAARPIQRTGNPIPSTVEMITKFLSFYGQFGYYDTPIVIDLNSKWKERKIESVLPEEWDGDAEEERNAESNLWPRTDVVQINRPDNSLDNLASGVPYCHWMVVWKAFELMAIKLAASNMEISYKKPRGSGINALPIGQRYRAKLEKEQKKAGGGDPERLEELRQMIRKRKKP